ncbi:endoplasmic reticulum-Golgi intermediate compartment protein 3 [Rhodotorula toruloides]|uniref:Endoplasmic reticulum-Golgi intermediate compartment protein 3 n=1 Tax=Rhodotorula toruloides TaxID=5286 RepID=A0A511KS40_RHOTO|nr:endoplasmic reticulum-Golgi intermediate compartment protein 3 [Rhodotorula toruloides]GEM12767.1 endoplasmic reticulum-Golgi intermediate compartment protein 3 [Rhodotorula toruloides]
MQVADENPPSYFASTNPTYREKTTRGGVFTVLVGLVVAVLVWHETREFLWGEAGYEFSVDRGIAHELQLNFDATVATPCHYLTVDVRDAVGDRLHVSDEFKKDGTTFDVGQAQHLESQRASKEASASKMIYGSMEVKKVTGNLHITTLGHGYLSWEHTDHALMNLSHVIHEFSFGPYFPRIVQPLDNSVEITSVPFHIFQYFLSVVSTTYVDASRRRLHTHQYSVTEMGRETQHGRGVPGIFFKYDIEPMSLTVRERTTTFLQFLIRLAGIVGGILVCSDFGFRTADHLVSHFLAGPPKTPLPGFVPSPAAKPPNRSFASGFGRD